MLSWKCVPNSYFTHRYEYVSTKGVGLQYPDIWNDSINAINASSAALASLDGEPKCGKQIESIQLLSAICTPNHASRDLLPWTKVVEFIYASIARESKWTQRELVLLIHMVNNAISNWDMNSRVFDSDFSILAKAVHSQEIIGRVLKRLKKDALQKILFQLLKVLKFHGIFGHEEFQRKFRSSSRYLEICDKFIVAASSIPEDQTIENYHSVDNHVLLLDLVQAPHLLQSQNLCTLMWQSFFNATTSSELEHFTCIVKHILDSDVRVAVLATALDCIRAVFNKVRINPKLPHACLQAALKTNALCTFPRLFEYQVKLQHEYCKAYVDESLIGSPIEISKAIFPLHENCDFSYSRKREQLIWYFDTIADQILLLNSKYGNAIPKNSPTNAAMLYYLSAISIWNTYDKYRFADLVALYFKMICCKVGQNMKLYVEQAVWKLMMNNCSVYLQSKYIHENSLGSCLLSWLAWFLKFRQNTCNLQIDTLFNSVPMEKLKLSCPSVIQCLAIIFLRHTTNQKNLPPLLNIASNLRRKKIAYVLAKEAMSNKLFCEAILFIKPIAQNADCPTSKFYLHGLLSYCEAETQLVSFSADTLKIAMLKLDASLQFFRRHCASNFVHSAYMALRLACVKIMFNSARDYSVNSSSMDVAFMVKRVAALKISLVEAIAKLGQLRIQCLGVDCFALRQLSWLDEELHTMTMKCQFFVDMHNANNSSSALPSISKAINAGLAIFEVFRTAQNVYRLGCMPGFLFSRHPILRGFMSIAALTDVTAPVASKGLKNVSTDLCIRETSEFSGCLTIEIYTASFNWLQYAAVQFTICIVESGSILYSETLPCRNSSNVKCSKLNFSVYRTIHLTQRMLPHKGTYCISGNCELIDKENHRWAIPVPLKQALVIF